MKLNPMQLEAGKTIQQHHNVLLLSPTGSGKTLAYLLPLIARIDASLDSLQAVVVVPSRELAAQVEQVFKSQTKTSLRGLALYGGRPTMEEHRRIREIRPQGVFATPGRLLDHIGKKNLNILGVKLLVLDEYDKCLELGFREEMHRIGEAMNYVPQVVVASATAFEEDKRDVWGERAATSENGKPKKVLPVPALIANRKFTAINYLDTAEELSTRLTVCEIDSPQKDKLETLAKLLTHIGGVSSIVFVAHRESVERVGQYLRDNGFAVSLYHGGQDQEIRERSLYRFCSGAASVMVSTDLAARGLDIPEVRAIVHYHLPLDAATFAHRSGRTARWDAEGTAYLLVGPEEKLPEFIKVDETANVDGVVINAPLSQWAVLYIGRGKKDKLSKADILGFLCKKGGLTAPQIGRIDVNPHTSYVAIQRIALKRLLQQVSGEKIKGMKTLIEEMRAK